ncbi:MAG: hypothetical protein Q8Q33_03595 [Chlamydiota bacterium]|nr:hypothetical protein [Chlamydiota bacterium]
MLGKDKRAMKNWVQRWEKTGRILNRLKQKEIWEADTQKSVALLEDAFISALWLHPPSPTSGLIEQQRLYRLAKK